MSALAPASPCSCIHVPCILRCNDDATANCPPASSLFFVADCYVSLPAAQ